MTIGWIMKVSRNGQVSLPAQVRARWRTDRVTVVDLGEYVVVRPTPDDPLGALIGKYAGRGPSTDEARRIEHEEDEEHERRKFG